MLAIIKALKGNKDYEQLRERIESGGCPALLSGVSGIHKAHIISGIRRETGKAVVVVSSDELEAERMGKDLSAITGEEVEIIKSREYTFYNAEGVSRQAEHERVKSLYRLMSGTAGVVVATPDALMQRTIPAERLRETGFTISKGGKGSPEEVIKRLESCGYKRSVQVEGVGQYAVRGGIVDIYSPAYSAPVRCEYYDDEIDTMGKFDIETQRRIEDIETVDILPAAESLISLHEGGESGFLAELRDLYKRVSKRKNVNASLKRNIEQDIERLESGQTFSSADRYMGLLYREVSTAAEYISEGAAVFLCEPARLAERGRNYEWRMNEDIETLLEGGWLDGSTAQYHKAWDECCNKLARSPVVMLDSFRGGTYPLAPRTLLTITAKQLPIYGGSLSTAAGDIVHYLKDGYRVVVLSPDRKKAEIMREYLERTGIPSALDYNLNELPEEACCIIGIGGISAGMEYPGIKLAVFTEGQIQVKRAAKVAAKRSKNKERILNCSDLSSGDLVVHEHHGIGRFMGIIKIPVDGVEKDYIKIAYSGTDSLYVPATQLDMVSKYIGAGEERPARLNKLGGTEWQRAKTRAKAAVKDLAKGLIVLYAERLKRPGYAFAQDSVWQQEFEESFEYVETADQLRAAAEIKGDMEKPIPMDRLLCGDVGFGKTEVALRAVMKCVMNGKQAAILVPTTVLAQQHYVTIVKRFANYPVHIDVLSRFRTAAQMRQTIRNIKNGSTDIAIGTHRLIQKDVVFKDLGLLIVDEEQRFGVSHKEKLKRLANQVDVLTLSATPIPRTLNMALAGIRDMSNIEEPPSGRHPVQTYVLEHDWSVLCDAIRREISRGGQVYYLHNRVETIDRTAARIAALLEGITVMTAHGQMNEEELNGVMEKVSSGEVQVLVCTTIIETGIDIPNVNTLIIEDADKLGLAQLHQIRGRVGRSSRHAFAYFTFRRGKILSEIATKRLSTIREFAEFNSGFKIAMRDLEIRGAGNLLGAEQSGHMLSVGFDMYLKLLEEAVLEEKGEKVKPRTKCSADLTVSANIPEYYVDSPEQRMDLYRRIAMLEDKEEASDMTDELIDRYGEPPEAVNTLIRVALLRTSAADAGILEITQKSGRLHFKLAEFDMARISLLYGTPDYRGRIKVEAGTNPSVSLKLNSGGDVINQAESFVQEYKGLYKEVNETNSESAQEAGKEK